MEKLYTPPNGFRIWMNTDFNQFEEELKEEGEIIVMDESTDSSLEWQATAIMCSMVEEWFKKYHQGELSAHRLSAYLHGAIIFCEQPDVTEELILLRQMMSLVAIEEIIK